MKNMQRVQQVKNGFIIGSDEYKLLCKGILDAVGKLRFLEESFIALEDKHSSEDNPFYGMDSILSDIASGCDEIYESLDYIPT